MTRPPSESPVTPGLTWAAAFVLTLFLAAVAVSGSRLTARWGHVPAAVAAGAAALLLLLILVRLLIRHRSAVSGTAWRAAESGQLAEQVKQYQAELAQQAAGAQQLQAQLTQCLSELEHCQAQRRAEASARAASLEKAFDQLARVQLPLALTGSPVPPLAEETVGDRQLAALCGELLATVSSGAAQLHEQLDEQRETARLAVVALARRVQASAHRIQEEATRMAQRHSADPDVLESSMRVDHAAAQQARHAQSMAVLSGEWPGQQWSEPLPLVDVARAAAGRIVPYQRVSVSGDPDVAAAPRVAEPLIHLVAELLANATQSSPPASQVLVTVRAVQRGAVIEIDDGGVGMDEHRLQQAREVASGRRLASLTSLGEIPQTGLAVVGQYARRHGFGVDLVPSPYGGIRAVTLIPAELLQVIDPAGTVPAHEPAAPAPAAPAAAGTAGPQAAPAAPPAEPVGAHAAVAADAAPADAVPADAVPAGAVPAEAVPAEALSAEEGFSDAAPAAAAPADAVPAEAASSDARSDAVPAGAASSDARPAAAQPADAVPAEAAWPDARPAAAQPAGAVDAGAAPADAPPSDVPSADAAPAEVTAAGLPQRRSRRGEARAATAGAIRPIPGPPDPAGTGPLPTPAEAGAWMGAFLSVGVPAAPQDSSDASPREQRSQE